MKKLFSLALAAVAVVVSNAASIGCIIAMMDEPTAPKSMMD